MNYDPWGKAGGGAPNVSTTHGEKEGGGQTEAIVASNVRITNPLTTQVEEPKNCIVKSRSLPSLG